MQVYEYVIMKEPTPEEIKTGKTTELLVGITSVVANTQEQATMLAGRAVPESELVNIDRITVAVRPF